MENSPQYVIEMLHITKEFPGIKANDDITLQLRKGEIHALLGENGAGKSTLMSVLFGLYQPEEGEIRKNGQTVKINDPNDATALGIGMVHQVSQLVIFGGGGVCYAVKQRVGPLVSQQKGIAFAFIGNNASGRFSKSFATELVVSDNCWHIRPFVSLRIF